MALKYIVFSIRKHILDISEKSSQHEHNLQESNPNPKLELLQSKSWNSYSQTEPNPPAPEKVSVSPFCPELVRLPNLTQDYSLKGICLYT